MDEIVENGYQYLVEGPFAITKAGTNRLGLLIQVGIRNFCIFNRKMDLTDLVVIEISLKCLF